jgi:hypothetical protein
VNVVRHYAPGVEKIVPLVPEEDGVGNDVGCWATEKVTVLTTIQREFHLFADLVGGVAGEV